MEPSRARQLLADARIGHLATITPESRPHLVPCCFVLHEDSIYSAVDAKPKKTNALRRIANIKANPSACLLVDHYDEDWTTLFWIRVDGTGRVVNTEHERTLAIELLRSKYAQYSQTSFHGDVIAVEIETWRSWRSG